MCAVPLPILQVQMYGLAKKIAPGGGEGGARRPLFPTPPLLLVRCAGKGGSARRVPYLLCRGGGGGSTPTAAAQNNPLVALIILTPHTWGKIFWWKKLFRAKNCAPAPWVPTSIAAQNKGPSTEAQISTPPPPSLEQFSGCPYVDSFGSQMSHDMSGCVCSW